MKKPFKKPIGICLLCGLEEQLSFEHTPPRAAFNSGPVLEMCTDYLLHNTDPLAYLDLPKGKLNQKGSGGYTLCASCNNWTGSKYASHYQDFCQQLMPIAKVTKEGHGVAFEIEFCPLNVLKHIALMYLTSNSETFQKQNNDLVQFVNEPRSVTIPRRFKFWLALTSMENAKFSRSSGVSGSVDLENNIGFLHSEIAYPPLINVLSINSPRPEQRLTKINWFRHYELETKVRLQLSLFALAIASPFPTDYRSEAQVRDAVAQSYFQIT